MARYKHLWLDINTVTLTTCINLFTVYRKELADTKRELDTISEEIDSLLQRQSSLQQRKTELESILRQSSSKSSDDDKKWSNQGNVSPM
jgi:chromosome segregation ATPase